MFLKVITRITGMLSKGGKWGKGCRESGEKHLTQSLKIKIIHFIDLL